MTADSWTVKGIVKRMVPLILLLSCIELYSGIVLDSLQQDLIDHPALLILVPAMISMGGNLGSILAARLSTALHLGTINPRADGFINEKVANDSTTVLLLGTTLSLVMAGGTYVAAILLGTPTPFTTILGIAVASSVALSVFIVIVAILTTMLSFRLGWDPDDVAIPIVTNMSDVAGVVILSLVILATV